MLPDLSPTHIMIVVVVALVVVGPKDLPMLLRKIGQFMGKMRGMANEFRASFDEMARQSELDELRKEVEAMRAASQTAIAPDLGINAALNSDAEGAYMHQWQASQDSVGLDAMGPSSEPMLPGLPDPSPHEADPHGADAHGADPHGAPDPHSILPPPSLPPPSLPPSSLAPTSMEAVHAAAPAAHHDEPVAPGPGE